MVTGRTQRQSVVWVLGIGLWMAAAAPAAAQMGLYEHLMTFSSVLHQVQSSYTDSVDASDLVDAAIRGVLRSLDPHSIYLPPDEAAQFALLEEGTQVGVGVEFAVVGGVPTVMSVRRDSRAERGRIHTGDVLVSVDGRIVAGVTEPELALLLAGRPGSRVKLGFRRLLAAGGDATYSLTLKREARPAASLTQALLLPDRTAYLRLTHFSEQTGREVADAVHRLEGEGMRALVLDLRDNPGGSLKSALAVVDLFMPEGEVLLETRGRKEAEVFTSTRKRAPVGCPLVVLVNEGSASAAEVVAGSLQDHDRALVVGTTTFGKGLVQVPFPLENGGLLLMTVARYYTPSGRLIQRPYEGMTPEAYYASLHEPLAASGEAFKTRGGRTVYGGGGITPDVVVPAAEVPEAVRRLDEDGVLFEQAAAYVASAGPSLEALPGFADAFVLGDTLFAALAERAATAGLSAGALPRDALAAALRREIVRVRWGEAEALFLGVPSDPPLAEALRRAPEAFALRHAPP